MSKGNYHKNGLHSPPEPTSSSILGSLVFPAAAIRRHPHRVPKPKSFRSQLTQERKRTIVAMKRNRKVEPNLSGIHEISTGRRRFVSTVAGNASALTSLLQPLLFLSLSILHHHSVSLFASGCRRFSFPPMDCETVAVPATAASAASLLRRRSNKLRWRWLW